LKFCAAHDHHWLVLDHLAKPDLRAPGARQAVNPEWAAQLRMLGQLPHVVCKLSGLVTETGAANGGLTAADEQAIEACYDLALEAFGPQRLLFGSDWPVCALAAPFEVVHGLAQRWAQSRLSDTEQADFWGGNAQRCYGLKLAA
jgi:L-fuconolactonase